MKPTFQVGRPALRGDPQRQFGQNRKSPATDWSFQTPAANLQGSGSSSFKQLGSHPLVMRNFRALSDGFFALEAKRESRLEGALFAVIVALAAWPMVLAAQAAAALLK